MEVRSLPPVSQTLADFSYHDDLDPRNLLHLSNLPRTLSLLVFVSKLINRNYRGSVHCDRWRTVSNLEDTSKYPLLHSFSNQTDVIGTGNWLPGHCAPFFTITICGTSEFSVRHGPCLVHRLGFRQANSTRDGEYGAGEMRAEKASSKHV